MTFFPRALLFVILLFIPGWSSAQEILSSAGQHVNYRIPYLTNDGKVYDYGNMILRELSKDVLLEPWLVQVRFSCDLGLSVVKAEGKMQLKISLRNPVIDGDTVYRHFPVTVVLLPSLISMKLRWANRADTSGYVEVNVAGKPLPPADSLICVLPVASYDPAVDTLLVRDVELFYDSLALNKFLDRIELIHDYYAAVALLDSLHQFTTGLQLDNAKLLPVNYLKIEELSNILAQVDARDFSGRLSQNGFDPSGLTGKYQQMFKHSRSLLYNFIDEMHRTGIAPWDGDVERLAGYFTSRVLSYVSRSYLMDQQQGRIYRDCLDHFFDQSAFPPEEKVAASMLAKMFPDAGQDTIARYISRRIYASYRKTAQQLMGQNRYAEAFSMLDNARSFVSANTSLKGSEPDILLQSQAAEGIFNSYVGIASSCIRSRKYNMAETYLSKADQYAETHSEYIRSDSIYRVVFSELFFLRNADCDALLEQKRYAEALDCYQQFEKSYAMRDLALVSKQLDEKRSLARFGLGNLSAALTEDALKRKDGDTALFYYEQARTFRKSVKTQEPVDVRLDSLVPVMAGIKYEQIYREGAVALEKRQYTLAVSLLKAAKTLADTNRIDRGREFDSLYRKATKFYLIVQLSSSQKKIWANQFDSAQVALQRTEAAGFDFGLLNDPDFNTAIEHYKVKIREQQCRNLMDSVDLRMIRADRNAALKNYTNTTRYFQEALKFITSDTACHFDQKALTDSLARYKDPSGYQHNENMVNGMIAVGDYSGAINLLMENRDLFKEANLSGFGLKQVDVYEFIAGKNNPYLSEYAALSLQNTGRSREAFRYLALLRDQGVPAKQVSGLQISLGEALAGSDHAEDPTAMPDSAILRYEVENEWFDIFRKAYLSEGNRKM